MPPLPPGPSRRRWFIYGGVALGLGIAVWYFGFYAKPAPAANPYSSWRSGAQVPPVKVAPVVSADLTVHLKSIGTVSPLNTVTVRSRVDGQLLRVHFTEGQKVEQGTLLAEIDPSPYRIRLAEAEGQQRQNLAQVESARSDLRRFQQLHAQNLLTNQELELQQARVAEREGALSASQAQAENARLQLGYTRIEAPISGRLGLRRVDAGNLVRASDAGGLVVLTQTRPISVLFTVPEVDLQRVLDPLRRGEALAVEAWDRSETTLLGTGSLRTVDNQIDATTGTLRLKAEFPNDDDRLFPNQFVNARLRVETLRSAVVVPAACIQHGSRGTYVFVVDEKTHSVVRDVVLGPSDGTRQAILKGLAPGERVVLEGIDRLRDGRPVSIIDGASAPPAPPAPPANRRAGK
jgi:membrane fusion protein, multidrug efflux system